MILQSLCRLHRRLSGDPGHGLPRAGYSLQTVTFRVLLHPDGALAEIADTRYEETRLGGNGKEVTRRRAPQMLLPGRTKPPGPGFCPGFLWDNPSYLLGYKPGDANPERGAAAFHAFRQKHLKLEATLDDPAFSAVCRFLEGWQPERAAGHPVVEAATFGFGVFQIVGQPCPVHEQANLAAWWDVQNDTDSAGPVPAGNTGMCLATGKTGPIAILHEPTIKGVAGAHAIGAKLASFNVPACDSHGKNGVLYGQGRNAPVSVGAVMAYVGALNWLLAAPDRSFRAGDATAVFWTEEPTVAETLFPCLMDGRAEPGDSSFKEPLARIREKIDRGTLEADDLGDKEARFYLLGLSPNLSRLSVRFWHSGRLGELAANLQRHFDHMRVIRLWDEGNSAYPDPPLPSLYLLLRQTAREVAGISPLLAGAFVRAVVQGTPYPPALANAVLNRMRVIERRKREQGIHEPVNYLRVCLLKAWLIRNRGQAVSFQLDEASATHGYRLGRLFAVLEKTQREAQPNLITTIGERNYGRAAATPRTVFTGLLRRHRHHLGQLAPISKVRLETLTGEILRGMAAVFPACLDPEGQAQFALGCYHQHKALYLKAETAPLPSPTA